MNEMSLSIPEKHSGIVVLSKITFKHKSELWKTYNTMFESFQYFKVIFYELGGYINENDFLI